MMKKKWMQPKAIVEEFKPNEYVATCTYEPVIGETAGYGILYEDANHNGKMDKNEAIFQSHSCSNTFNRKPDGKLRYRPDQQIYPGKEDMDVVYWDDPVLGAKEEVGAYHYAETYTAHNQS